MGEGGEGGDGILRGRTYEVCVIGVCTKREGGIGGIAFCEVGCKVPEFAVCEECISARRRRMGTGKRCTDIESPG